LKKTTTHLRYILYTIRGEKKKGINTFVSYIHIEYK
jgi:hypothetical protein